MKLSTRQREQFVKQEAGDIFPEYYVLRVNEFDELAKTPLDEWIYFLKTGEIDEHATAKGLPEAREKLRIDKLSPSEKGQYYAHMEALRYQKSVIETELSAGMDIRANIAEPISLAPMQRCLVPTGLFIALPQGFEAQIRPRSGLALKKGITVLNSPGTIDADYRGEICIILVNLSAETFVIEDGERIAQMVIARHEQAVWKEVEVLDETERGAGGFGHTGRG